MLEVAYEARPTFRDASTRFRIVGVLLLLCAAVGVLLTVLLAVGIVMESRATGVDSDTVVAFFVVGLVDAIVLHSGIGAIRRRRWVRPIGLIFGTLWLVSGACTCVAALLSTLLYGSYDRMADLVALVLLAAVAVALPAWIVLLLRPEFVRQTSEYYDARPRWTDRISVSVLGLTITLAVAAVGQLGVLMQPVVPVGPYVLSGRPVEVATVIESVALGYAAWRVLRRDMLGWWIGLVACELPIVLTIPTALLLPWYQIQDLYLGAEDADRFVHENLTAFRAVTVVALLLAGGAFAVYMLRVRRDLRPATVVPPKTA